MDIGQLPTENDFIPGGEDEIHKRLLKMQIWFGRSRLADLDLVCP